MAADVDEEHRALLRECDAIDRACANAVQPVHMDREACAAASCCVCFEPLSLPLWQCEQCGNPTHEHCFSKWRTINNSCPMCRHSVSSSRDEGTACCCILACALVSILSENVKTQHVD